MSNPAPAALYAAALVRRIRGGHQCSICGLIRTTRLAAINHVVKAHNP